MIRESITSANARILDLEKNQIVVSEARDDSSISESLGMGGGQIVIGGGMILAGHIYNNSASDQAKKEVTFAPNNIYSWVAEYEGFKLIFEGLRNCTYGCAKKINKGCCTTAYVKKYCPYIREIITEPSKTISRTLSCIGTHLCCLHKKKK